MHSRIEILIARDSNGYYVATVTQFPEIRLEGGSPEDLEAEMREALLEGLDLGDNDILIVRRL